MGVTNRGLESPDETRTFDNGQVQVVKIGETTIGRYTFEPGWRWSESIKPIRPCRTSPRSDVDKSIWTSDHGREGSRRSSLRTSDLPQTVWAVAQHPSDRTRTDSSVSARFLLTPCSRQDDTRGQRTTPDD